MRITILTIFPEYFDQLSRTSILGRALRSDQAELEVINIRDFSDDKHRTVDDRPYGGGAGMVMKVEPIAKALDSLAPRSTATARTILTSAKGELFDQQRARDYARLENLVIVCGHYQGVDERVARHLVDEEVRIGDYVLTGGEPAAAVMLDAVVRLLPGVLGNESSTKNESHSLAGMAGHPQYTRPVEFRGWTVPEELLGGDHARIEEWRRRQRQLDQTDW